MLSGWKAFDNLELDLRAGTTFILSSNGVGKSSLVDGAL
jgi:predicted ATPase